MIWSRAFQATQVTVSHRLALMYASALEALSWLRLVPIRSWKPIQPIQPIQLQRWLRFYGFNLLGLWAFAPGSTGHPWNAHHGARAVQCHPDPEAHPNPNRPPQPIAASAFSQWCSAAGESGCHCVMAGDQGDKPRWRRLKAQHGATRSATQWIFNSSSIAWVFEVVQKSKYTNTNYDLT